MNQFNKKAAQRIALVTVLLVATASPIAGFLAREQAEDAAVSFAIEESRRLLHHQHAMDFEGPQGKASAETAARLLSGGLFDIVEIYNRQGEKLAEVSTEDGESIETLLPKHSPPFSAEPQYESFDLADRKYWVLRVFVPLKLGSGQGVGYFEGVRIVPDWQRDQIRLDALATALMVALAALLCGGALYPVVVYLAADNEAKARDVLESHISMMEALGRAIAKRDSDTGAHNYRVAWIAAMLGESIGLQGASMQSLIAGSFLHDAGKIGIPDAILLKPGRLDAEEMAVMRQHVGLGEEIVSGAGWLDGARAVVACHHEKWDGSGYPQGLSGAAIPLSARIFAIADVFDALCAQRPYKPPLPFDAAMAILREGRGQHFDPDLLDQFDSMAVEIHGQAMHASEDEARQLMEEMVRKHFEL